MKVELDTRIADIKIGEMTITHEHWERSPAAVLSFLGDATAQMAYTLAHWTPETFRASVDADINAITAGIDLPSGDIFGIGWIKVDERWPEWGFGDCAYDSGEIPCAPNPDQRAVRTHDPFPARALRSEPDSAPLLEWPE